MGDGDLDDLRQRRPKHMVQVRRDEDTVDQSGGRGVCYRFADRCELHHGAVLFDDQLRHVLAKKALERLGRVDGTQPMQPAPASEPSYECGAMDLGAGEK